MQIRGTRRRKNVDRGFAMSDHVDWPGLMDTIRETGAQRVIATHGSSEVLARWMREQGIEAEVWSTAWAGEASAEESGTATETVGEGDSTDSKGADTGGTGGANLAGDVSEAHDASRVEDARDADDASEASYAREADDVGADDRRDV